MRFLVTFFWSFLLVNTAVFIVSAVDAVAYDLGFATAMSVVTALVVFALDAVNEDLGLGQGTKAE